jgi:dienelactone hydrolase
MSLEEKMMRTVQLGGSYHQKPMDVYLYSPGQQTNVVTIVCKGLYSVFDPNHACGVNVLGDMLIDNNTSHVVFYNSSREYSFAADSSFESRKAAFINKTFGDELADLRTVIQYVIDHAQDEFGIRTSDLVLYLHGTSIGGTISLLVTADFPQVRKLSLCAPPSGRGNSKKPIVSTMPDPAALFAVASQFTGYMFLLYGGNDSIVPKESAFAIVAHASKARTTTLTVPNADHDFRKLDGKETPDAHRAFAKAIFDFFSSRATP